MRRTEYVGRAEEAGLRRENEEEAGEEEWSLDGMGVNAVEGESGRPSASIT